MHAALCADRGRNRSSALRRRLKYRRILYEEWCRTAEDFRVPHSHEATVELVLRFVQCEQVILSGGRKH